MDRTDLDTLLQEELKIRVTTGARFNEYKPKQFQIDLAKEFVSKLRYGCYDQTGVGKTGSLFLSILAWVVQGNKVAFITKPELFSQIIRDWDDWFTGLDFKPSKKIGSKVLLMSHTAITIERYYKRIGSEYPVLVIDEYHKMKNGEGRRFRTLQALMARNRMAVLIATGTPIVKDILDAYSCIKITNPIAYRDYKHFLLRHRKMKKVKKRDGSDLWLFDRFVNENAVQKNLAVNSRRLMKRDVWGDLEEPIIAKRYMVLEKSQVPIYNEFTEFLIFENNDGELFDASYSPTLKFTRSIQSISCPVVFENEAKSCILEDVKTIAESVTIDNKLIVFTLFATTAKWYVEQLKEYNPAIITGDKSESDKFVNDPDCKVLVATFGAGAEGYNFQTISSYVYLAEYLPVGGWLEQAANRVFRPHQKQAATIYLPVVTDTVYEKAILKSLKEREKINQKVIESDFSLTT